MKPVAEQTLYEILEVPFDAPEAEIVRAWERVEALYGPGSLTTYTLISPDEAALLGGRLEEALNVLLDPAQRRRYDARICCKPASRACCADGTGAPSQPAALPPIIPPLARPRAAAPLDLLLPSAATEGELVAVAFARVGEPGGAAGAEIDVAPRAPASPPASPAREAGEEGAVSLVESPTETPTTVELSAPTTTEMPIEDEPPGTTSSQAAAGQSPVPASAPRLDERDQGSSAGSCREDEGFGEAPAPIPLANESLGSTGTGIPIEKAAATPTESADSPLVPRAPSAGENGVSSLADTPAILLSAVVEAPPPPIQLATPVPVSPPFAAIAEAPAALPRAEPPLAVPRPAPSPAPAERELIVPEGTLFTGEVLRRAREARGLTMRQMCERTKITRHHVENLEADCYEKLPAPVYLRGILMAIAKELRLDGQKVARSYFEAAGTAAAQVKPR